MNEFESTLKGDAPTSQTVAVYDAGDGRIVYTHEFIGDGKGLFGPEGRAERERTALEAAERHGQRHDRLRVLHLPTGFRFENNKFHSVDLNAGTVIVSADVSHGERFRKC
jgi:hypothetical protein